MKLCNNNLEKLSWISKRSFCGRFYSLPPIVCSSSWCGDRAEGATNRNRKMNWFGSVRDLLIGNKTMGQLSHYDIARAPRMALPSGDHIEVPEETILSEIKCHICLGVITETAMIKLCCHRFCRGCITKTINATHTCPLCLTKITSHRCLQPDPIFDSLIECLYPSRDRKGDSLSEKRVDLSALRRQHNEKVAQMRERARIMRESNENQTSTTAYIKSGPSLPQRSSVSGAYAGIKRTRNELGCVCLCLCPHPDLGVSQKECNLILHPGDGDGQMTTQPLPIPISMFTTCESMRLFIRVPALTTVLDLKTYLFTKFPVSNDTSSLHIVMLDSIIQGYPPDKPETLLPDTVTMKDVCLQYWDKNSELVLYYYHKTQNYTAEGRGPIRAVVTEAKLTLKDIQTAISDTNTRKPSYEIFTVNCNTYEH
eukprot:gene8122-16666_t